ncbi:MAG: type I-C CRISPR-associated protein Cas7/Csd2 [Aquabacterium sp.]|nr:type I-C CRISPR-associated protein Cas7/Csd2 [Aquabacterium sp.]
MTTLSNKIDFAIIFRVSKANPNGDPLNGNRPRIDFAGHGEVTDVCLKRKIRDRLLDRFEALEPAMQGGQKIFVQSDERRVDEAKNLRMRAETVLTPDVMKSRDCAVKVACAEWFDVRAFGQVFPFKAKKGKKSKGDEGEAASEQDSDGVSIPVRGPVTIQSAFSVDRIDIESTQIVKSTSLEGDGEKRQSDQMGMKHRVHQAVYVAYGSINPQLAERTHFSDADAEVLKAIFPKLFENDTSSARPDGSMAMLKVVWWRHNSKSGQYSSAKVHGSINVQANGSISVNPLPGLEPEMIEGF